MTSGPPAAAPRAVCRRSPYAVASRKRPPTGLCENPPVRCPRDTKYKIKSRNCWTASNCKIVARGHFGNTHTHLGPRQACRQRRVRRDVTAGTVRRGGAISFNPRFAFACLSRTPWLSRKNLIGAGSKSLCPLTRRFTERLALPYSRPAGRPTS